MNQIWTVLLTIMVYIHSSSQSNAFQINKFDGFKSFSFRIMGTTAAPTNIKIDSATFESDLYSVLGVSRDCSKSELKEAYMKIVFRCHPDRNSTDAALATFRNATYAYQILGKDEKARLAYNRKLDAQSYMNALEDVGNDIIKPLAMDVAVPIFQMVTYSVGKFAFPLIRDVFEQSSAVVKATISAENSDTFDDIVYKASMAREKIANDQKIRKLENKISKLVQSMNVSLNKLIIVENAERESISKTSGLNATLDIEMKTKEKFEKSRIEAKELFDNVFDIEKVLGLTYQQEVNELSLLHVDSNKATNDIVKLTDEVTRLEKLLFEAKTNLQNRKLDFESLQSKIKPKMRQTQELEKKYSFAVESKNDAEIKFKKVQIDANEFDKTLRNLKSESDTWNTKLKEDRRNKSLLTSAIISAELQINRLEDELNSIKSQQEKIEADMLLTTGNILLSSAEVSKTIED